jgi:multiple sugar transport system permease protein
MNEKRLKAVLLYTGMVFMSFFSLFPVLWMIAVSLSENPYFLFTGNGFSFTLNHYATVIFNESVPFIAYLKNSFIVSLLSGAFATLFASLSAYAVTRMRFPGKRIIPLGMLSISMFPQICIIGYLFQFMASLKWINTYNALVFPYIALALPLGLWVMMSYFSQLPVDLDRAALVDGASRLQVIIKILFPISLPGIFSTFLLIFIFSFNEFLFALMLTVDCRARTIPVGIALFQGLHGQIPWGSVTAAAAIASLPPILITLLFQKYIVQGLTEGAVKG